MGEIKKQIITTENLTGTYTPVFTFSDNDASASNINTCLTSISNYSLTNKVYTFSGSFLWNTSAANIFGNVIISISIPTSVIYSGIIQTNVEMTNNNHFAYWNNPSFFLIESTLANHSQATYSFTFIYS
jgi:hypothetical protein